MPYELRARHGGKLVIVRHHGHVDCAEIVKGAEEIDRLVDPNKDPRMLVDVRGAESFPDDKEFFTQLWQRNEPSPQLSRLAFVTNARHAETIHEITSEHITRGAKVRVFYEELEALSWLMRSRNSDPIKPSEAAFRELSTVRIFVSDIERAREFYSKELRLGSFEYDEPDHEMFFKLDNIQLVIQQIDDDDPKFTKLVGRCTGMAFRVLDIDAVYVRLKSLGVEFSGEPEIRSRSGLAVDLEDPDGNVLTLVS